ncbi:hypothetical protein RE474_01925 [Methanolobus sediminis]|uniref:Uncharacterized protein n=1 Tax=Methanolobus sediminis TaxID=3072978 RepID=A0AA51UNC8_9EURY|nr:hypothetical protein [Methanolobus sediminis]WMW25501.1 hypothetical protein RE474_01925 [Methanolobus sediminis]
MVFYLVITAAIIFLMAFSWNNMAPVYSGAKDSKQINSAVLDLVSIQDGYARNLQAASLTEGSMCNIELSLPDVSFLSFGVDPDPDINGNLSDSSWIVENNTIICQYKSGVRNLYHIDGDTIIFKKGKLDNSTGLWVPDESVDSTGIVVEGPISGTFNFELILDDGKYTLSHF